MILIMFCMLALFIIIGIPIAFSIGLTSLVTIFLLGDTNLMTALAQAIYAQTTSFPLLAIPFFILAGTIMNNGGVTDKVYRFALNMVGHFRGGLAHVNIVGSMIFAGMSGSAVADVAGMGKMEIKAMTDAGYDKRFSAAITAASSTIGPVIPPSIPFVVYGSITGVSVQDLFLGGIIPGFGMGIVMMIAVAIIAKRRNFPKEKFPPLKELLTSMMLAIPALGAPVIIIAGMTAGFFTATEASSSCVYLCANYWYLNGRY